MQEQERGIPEEYTNWKPEPERPESKKAEIEESTIENSTEKEEEHEIDQAEKERLIQEEKKKVLQEKIDELLEEFRALDKKEIASLINTGLMSGGQRIESRSLGSLEPDIAENFARAFRDGEKLISKILERLPDLLERFDKEITEEAERRVKERLKDAQETVDKEDVDEELRKDKGVEIIDESAGDQLK